jgi:hypothetical protein
MIVLGGILISGAFAVLLWFAYQEGKSAGRVQAHLDIQEEGLHLCDLRKSREGIEQKMTDAAPPYPWEGRRPKVAEPSPEAVAGSLVESAPANLGTLCDWCRTHAPEASGARCDHCGSGGMDGT